ncbi:MAG: pantoate--beta-alanine ligase, partial [Solirubrobacterales bacterium]
VVERRARESSLAEALDAGRRELAAAGVEPEYLEARNPEDLTSVEVLDERPVLIAVAARIGEARLIDNLTVWPKGTPSGDTEHGNANTEAQT